MGKVCADCGISRRLGIGEGITSLGRYLQIVVKQKVGDWGKDNILGKVCADCGKAEGSGLGKG